MQLITNSVAPNKVEEKADHYLIKSVPFVRAQELSGGYVPEWSIKQTANEWVGKKATLNHPRDNQGQPVPARTKPKTHLGEIVDSWFDGEFVRANIKLDKSELQSANAQQVKQALESGQQIHVSSQYHPRDLPAGEYDGEFRQNAEAISQPDSVAILPGKKGKCDIQDGCGINPQMVANAAVSLPMTQNEKHGEDMDAAASAIDFDGTKGGELDESEIPTEGFESHYVFAGETKTDSSFPLVDADGSLRRGNVESAFNLRGHAQDESKLLDVLRSVNSEFENPPIDSADLEDAMSANSGHIDRLLSFLGVGQTANSSETAGAESPVDNNSNDTMERDELISEIVANSKLSKSALEERCDDGLEAIHSDVTEDMSDNNNETDNGDKVVFDSQDEFEAAVEDIVANRVEQTSKEELATEIVANSADYEDTETVLEDFPTEAALETKKESLESSGTTPAGGITGNGVEIEANDNEFDVSGGVLTND